MFYAHNLNNHTISVKNLVLLFLTIVFGFGSIIVLAQLTIDTDISNARQTIAKITITDDGQETTPRLEFSATGIFIDSGILTPYTTFSGKVLGIDDNGNLIYTPSQGLVVSGVGAAGGSELRDEAGSDVYRYTGNVGIGTATMSGKLHLLGSGTTEVYIQETNPANAANINFKTTQQRWMLGGFNTHFYIGLSGSAFLNITTGGFVGINIETPSVPLQINGNIIAGYFGNIITGNNSAIIGGGNGGEANQISGNYSFIAGGKTHVIENGEGSAIIGGLKNNRIENTKGGFVLGGIDNQVYNTDYATIAGGNGNKIYSVSENAFIGGGNGNKIYSSIAAIINGGLDNIITGNSNQSIILGGEGNTIENSEHSLSAGYKAINSGYKNTFVRNSSNTTGFYAGKAASFLINVPGGMGINTNNPQAALDVSGDIRSNSLQLAPSSINTGAICTSTTGAIIYKNGHFYGCNGNRIQLD